MNTISIVAVMILVLGVAGQATSVGVCEFELLSYIWFDRTGRGGRLGLVLVGPAIALTLWVAWWG